jgi:hypothetical protein
MDEDRIERRVGTSCVTVLGAFLAGMVILALIGWAGMGYLKQRFLSPDPVTVAQASLQGLKEQNRLLTFTARYVAVVTSTQSQLGLTAQKTMILPGTARYELDLAKLQQRDVAWDAGAKRLTITLPPIEVVGPEVDFDHVREYSGGGILMALTNASQKLDAANRDAGRKELVRQAKEPTPMKLARDSARRAVERSFEMPLKAAGVDATVVARFADEKNDERWDESRPISEVLANAH